MSSQIDATGVGPRVSSNPLASTVHVHTGPVGTTDQLSSPTFESPISLSQ